MNNILVTGGAGFIGTNFIKYLLKTRKNINIINLDALTYAGNAENLADIAKDSRYIFQKGDICNSVLLSNLFSEYQIDTVVNFAAETHVDRSIIDPTIFLKSNIMGTQALLDVAMHYWKNTSNVKYLQISTDEVYGTLGNEGKFTETSPLAPNSPYSATKASADLMVRAYHSTYNLPICITRCSNNYGPYQFPEKLIPLMINNCCKNISLPIYGDGLQIRDWIYVEDHCNAILTVLEKGMDGEIYNIGGNNERTNIEIVRLILVELNKSENLITYIQDRRGHDRRYAVDNTKIITQLGWTPQMSFEEGIRKTLDWYMDNMKKKDQMCNIKYR